MSTFSTVIIMDFVGMYLSGIWIHGLVCACVSVGRVLTDPHPHAPWQTLANTPFLCFMCLFWPALDLLFLRFCIHGKGSMPGFLGGVDPCGLLDY